ncbi:outer membrane protein OmpA-like peptidoglycan-associated protein [Aquimarina sp. EL_43]|uniref:OmpA family protein n=1 Tax=unclassified Aquimarina TaxID=2627091 RepID=UPI0018CA36A3|nr:MULTISPECIES: OmpA family protein [unclassified Aquimarina]MBG6129743.1 outer membrane protein OmpA-like peptidoglycan-associated protein [Aquimarina sp. EL_35]MBG6150808.1 outer membrane protein OmpA-like peptidoglycan-associated protein [Aquimarina sp. EL_32]MBG6167885.1 outer membrane protein OmpA-like peptidoglycan-associated protein [Aquimarina sp. EL_43]
MIKAKILLILTILITQFTFSQQKSRADRFFEKGDYINAALQYEEELNQEGYTKHILKNITTSYYNTFQFRQAYRYLKVLTSGKFYDKDKTYDNQYNFMMYQVLSALGEYEKSVEYLSLYKSNNTIRDFSASDAISTIEDFKLKDDDYTIASAIFNSEASEFGAIRRDSILYFTTDRRPYGPLDKNYRWTHRPFLDIYKVRVDKDNKPVSEIEMISKEINSKLHEGNFCFTADGNTIYLSKSNSEKGKKKFDSINNNAIHLYKAAKVDGKWGEPEKLEFNNVNYSIEHPSLSAVGDTLYFSSNMPGGYGDFDIYFVAVNQDGTYGEPTNLGPTINTENREQFPFISEKGNLFFSSNGHLGLGMMDIFVSELRRGEFIKPINLGAPINSSYDDFSITYYNETDGFFASNRKKAGDDIYTFSQIGDIFPREYRARFEVRDYATDNYIANPDVVLYNNDNIKVYEGQLDSIAAFDIKIFPGRYNFKASANKYKTRTKPLVVKEKEEETYIIYLDRAKDAVITDESDDKNRTQINDSTNISERTRISESNTERRKEEITKTRLREILLADKDGPPVIERNGKLYFDMPPIYFDYDKWNIRADSKKVLDKLAVKLERYKTVYINISSHTDSRGTESYNQILSAKRAESTRNYLALVGYVNARRMQFVGFGESQPLIDCDSKVCTEEDHQTNRRSEFEIVRY